VGAVGEHRVLGLEGAVDAVDAADAVDAVVCDPQPYSDLSLLAPPLIKRDSR